MGGVQERCEINDVSTSCQYADYPLDSYIQPTTLELPQINLKKAEVGTVNDSTKLKHANKLLKKVVRESNVPRFKNQDFPERKPLSEDESVDDYAEKLVDFEFAKSTYNAGRYEPNPSVKSSHFKPVVRTEKPEFVSSNVNKRSALFKREGELHSFEQTTHLRKNVIRDGNIQQIFAELPERPVVHEKPSYLTTNHCNFDTLISNIDPIQTVSFPKNRTKNYNCAPKQTISPSSSQRSPCLKIGELRDKASNCKCFDGCANKKVREVLGDLIKKDAKSKGQHQNENLNDIKLTEETLHQPQEEWLPDSNFVELDHSKEEDIACCITFPRKGPDTARNQTTKLDVGTNTDPRINTGFVTVVSQQTSTSENEVLSSSKVIKVQELPILNIRSQLTKQVAASIDIPTTIQKFSPRKTNIGVVNMVYSSKQNKESCLSLGNIQTGVDTMNEVSQSSCSVSYCSKCKYCSSKEQYTKAGKHLHKAAERVGEENSSFSGELKESLECLTRSIEKVYSMQLKQLKTIYNSGGNSSEKENALSLKMKVVADLLTEVENNESLGDDRYQGLSLIIRHLTSEIESIEDCMNDRKCNSGPQVRQDDNSSEERMVSHEDKTGATADGTARKNKCSSKSHEQRTNSVTNIQQVEFQRESNKKSENRGDLGSAGTEKSRKLNRDSYAKHSVNKTVTRDIPFRKVLPGNTNEEESTGLKIKHIQQVHDIEPGNKLRTIRQNFNYCEMLKLDGTFALSNSSGSIEINPPVQNEVVKSNQIQENDNDYEEDWEPDDEALSEDILSSKSEGSTSKSCTVNSGKIEIGPEAVSEGVNLEPAESKNDVRGSNKLENYSKNGVREFVNESLEESNCDNVRPPSGFSYPCNEIKDFNNIFCRSEKKSSNSSNTNKEVVGLNSLDDLPRNNSEINKLHIDKNKIWAYVDERVNSCLSKTAVNTNGKPTELSDERQTTLEIRLPNLQKSLDGVFCLSTSNKEKEIKVSLTLPENDFAKVSQNKKSELVKKIVAFGEGFSLQSDEVCRRNCTGSTMTDPMLFNNMPDNNIISENDTVKKIRNHHNNFHDSESQPGGSKYVPDLDKPNNQLEVPAQVKVMSEESSSLELRTSHGIELTVLSKCYDAPHDEAKGENVREKHTKGTMTDNVRLEQLASASNNSFNVGNPESSANKYLGTTRVQNLLMTNSHESEIMLPSRSSQEVIGLKESPYSTFQHCERTLTDIIGKVEEESVKTLAAELFKNVEDKIECLMAKVVNTVSTCYLQNDKSKGEEKICETNTSKDPGLALNSELKVENTVKVQPISSDLLCLVSPTDSLNVDSKLITVCPDQNTSNIIEPYDDLQQMVKNENVKHKNKKRSKLGFSPEKHKSAMDFVNEEYSESSKSFIKPDFSSSHKNIEDRENMYGVHAEVNPNLETIKSNFSLTVDVNQSGTSSLVTGIILDRPLEKSVRLFSNENDQIPDSSHIPLKWSQMKLMEGCEIKETRPSAQSLVAGESSISASKTYSNMHQMCGRVTTIESKMEEPSIDKKGITFGDNIAKSAFNELQNSGEGNKEHIYEGIIDAEDSSSEETNSFVGFDIPYYDTDNMSDGEVGYLYTSQSYSSGEIKPRDRKHADANSTSSTTDDFCCGLPADEGNADNHQAERNIEEMESFIEKYDESLNEQCQNSGVEQVQKLSSCSDINKISESNEKNNSAGVSSSSIVVTQVEETTSKYLEMQDELKHESRIKTKDQSDSSDANVPELLELLQKCNSSLTDSSIN